MQVSARSKAIKCLRELLSRQASPKHSLCQLMTESGRYCKGFAAWDDDELRDRFHWFCLSRPDIERDELEALADRWQLADQTARGLAAPCDIGATATPERRACQGWSRFTDEELLGFIAEFEKLEAKL